MPQVLMPKATAVWLVENTTLTFDQISAFTGLHPLEIQAIADGEVAGGMTGLDPTTNGQLTKEEIKRAEGDPNARLKLSPRDVPMPVARSKGPRYTPVAKRQDRPDAIAWLLKVHPELQDSQVAKLVGSTKSTVQSVRDRTHWNMQNVRPRDPVTLGLCTLKDLNDAVDKARRKAAREDAARKKAAVAAGEPEPTPAEPEPTSTEPEEPAETVDPAEADQPEVDVPDTDDAGDEHRH
ncbi:MAG TPA: cell cycle transcriptional regulator TrcR [Reyranella sp.]|nr:cell cycle transcriptional regulator TrcR [Reyranella sp.]